MSHTKTFDCEGCRPYCYGGYHMREDADGDGDYVLAEDFNRVKKQRDELLAALETAAQRFMFLAAYSDAERCGVRPSVGEAECRDAIAPMKGGAA